MLRVIKDEIGQEDEVELPLLVVAFVQGLEQRIWRCSPGESLVSYMSRVSGQIADDDCFRKRD